MGQDKANGLLVRRKRLVEKISVEAKFIVTDQAPSNIVRHRLSPCFRLSTKVFGENNYVESDKLEMISHFFR